MEGLLFLLVVIFLLSLYFTPTIIGIVRKKKDTIAIAVLNMFLGWTFVGWIISLVWALKTDTQNQVVVQQVVTPSDEETKEQK
ncbi:superinfection immunity protein [Peptococcaceae bacterium]|nr:superinfection immunity protein [Peptococcaceae bacterium]